MGVKGLESFVRENRTSLTKTIILPSVDQSGTSIDGTNRIPIIVDAWGIIFKLYLDSLPWTSGGEYLRYYKLVKKLVKGWRKVGLEPTFVFDGAGPPEKHLTTLSRAAEKLLACQLFYTTSVASRSSPSFARGGKVVLPFFASQAFTFALHRLGVKTHFVPGGEADAICVSMAEKVGGYVFGRDSDFIILIGRTERVRGYVPIDMMNWIEGPQSPNPSNGTGKYVPPAFRNGQPSETFQPVHNGRRQASQPYKNTNRQSSMIPSSTLQNPSLVLTFIPPQALRHRLRIPSTHLPLFASLCGTDYTPPHIIQRFFEPGLTMFQRIEKAARILREQLFSPTSSSSSKIGYVTNPADQVVELVKRVIKKLIIYPFDTEQDLDDTVNIIIEAALQYQLPSVEECCSTYPFCGELDPMLGCQTPISLGDARLPNHTKERMTGKEAYSAAQRDGLVGTIVHGWLYPDRMYQWQVLEDVSGPCLKASNGAREIRRKAWEIADQGLGGLRFPMRDIVDVEDDKNPELEEHDINQEEKELQDLLGIPKTEVEAQNEVTSLVQAEQPLTRTEPIREMIEYLRQGSTAKIISSPLILPPIPPLTEEKLPICQTPLEDRLRIYLQALHSDFPSIRSLPVSLQPLVSLIRFCVIDSLERSGKYGQNKWKRDEVYAVLRAGVGTYTMWKRELLSENNQNISQNLNGEEEGGGEGKENLYPMLENRNCNLIAQLKSSLSDIHILAQSLLLLPNISKSNSNQIIDKEGEIGLTHIIPFFFFNGINLHKLLLKQEPDFKSGWKWKEEEEEKLFKICWNSLIDNLDEKFIVGLNYITLPLIADSIKSKSENDVIDLIEEDLNGNLKNNNKKKKNKNKRKSSFILNQPSGRFGVLEGLID
ncbi:uncharacterized protein I206_102015 [Kwoniella pini CBS 10737]|uniref:Asteroid domain-containing protein n=1 Tax=Kwoniella pini CBS 10737 TaxID=1296096 RepID=A0A1B9HV19_9TREE|nr:uncharacterized protein I206_06893 [Kwoniella pini CBS 10737]OCF47117.1 hypothetical protein I206_06893 [Kwoniella pini CBS 10737]